MIHYKLDPSFTSVLGICREPGCGFRHLSLTKAAALRVRAEHEEIAHPRPSSRRHGATTRAA